MLVNSVQEIQIKYMKLYDMSNYKISIPIFQRFYDWNEKSVSELLNDIHDAIDMPDKKIYLLDFIWYPEDNMMKLADGQQRIVSLNILLKVLNDYIDDNHLGISKVKLFDILYDNYEYNCKYQASFTKYMKSPFKKMYLIMQEFVKNHNMDINSIIDIIKNRIFIYIKLVDNSDDAFKIFTQINTGGKPLSKNEVIKTAIDQYACIYGVPCKASMKELKNTITGYYKYLYSSAGKNFDTIAIMRFLKNEIVHTKQSFQKFVNYLDIISKSQNYSISYIIKYINRGQLNDILNIMAIKGIDINIKREYLDKIMLPLCLLSIVMTMKKSNPGGIIQTLYSSIIDSIKNNKKPDEICEDIARFINDNEEICKMRYSDFETYLGRKEVNYKIKESLLLMDVIIRTTSSNLNVANINLEHIYPQKPVSEWAINNWPTSSEEISLLVNNIGNFLLLNQSINKKIQNKYIDKKIIEYKKIIPKDIALQTEMNTVDFDRFTNEGAKYIVERQKFIAKSIYNNFNLAKVILPLS